MRHVLRRLPASPPRLRLTLTPSPRRHFSLSDIHPIILAPSVFLGLGLTLWSYKCLMMIIFQNRILYMPGIPFGARREPLPAQHSTLTWSTHRLALPHTTHTLAVASTTVGAPAPHKSHTVIIYLQGNAASAPLRVPSLSRVLSRLNTHHTHYTFVYPSYRGYWASSGRPSYSALAADTPAVLAHIAAAHPHARIVLWGQSIGCPIALHGLAAGGLRGRRVDVVLETPFTSVVEMVPAMWPERWLPYHYLGPFVRSRWDGVAALEKARAGVRRVLVLRAERDEIVPEAVGRRVEEAAVRILGEGSVRVVVVRGALHTMVLEKQQGVEEVRRFLEAA